MVWRLPNPQYGNEGFCLVGSHALLFIETLTELLNSSELMSSGDMWNHGRELCRELQARGTSAEVAEKRATELMQQRLAVMVPEPMPRKTGCSYDRLPKLQKWQLLTYVAHFLLTEEGPTPELTMLREAAVWHVYRSVRMFITSEPGIEGLVQATLQEHRAGNSYGYEEEEEENEEAAVQQEEDEDDEYDDTYWERERLRKEKLAGRLEDMLEDTVFWDRDWEMEYLYAGQPASGYLGDDISPGYFSHEPSLSEAASRFPTFADCKNHIKTLSMRVLKDFHTLGAREPAGEAAGEAQASGETSEAKAEDIGERELLMQSLVGGLGGYHVLTPESLKTFKENMTARIRAAARA